MMQMWDLMPNEVQVVPGGKCQSEKPDTTKWRESCFKIWSVHATSEWKQTKFLSTRSSFRFVPNETMEKR